MAETQRTGLSNPYSAPYPIKEDSTADQINDLFTLLFKNKGNLSIKTFDNATKAQIAPPQEKLSDYPPTTENELFINKLDNGSIYLGFRIASKVYQIKMTELV
jgi:hypothetical protein